MDINRAGIDTQYIKKKIRVGLKWNLVNQIVGQLIFIWFSIYLARLLGPEAYGLVGMVTVLSGFANLFIDFGFTSAVIYYQVESTKQLSCVFWFNVAIGIAIYAFFFAMAPSIASFYGEPQLVLITRVLGLSIIINSLTSLQGCLLSKEINFKKKVIIHWLSTILSYSLGFWLAFRGFEVWSIVWMTLFASSINSIILWLSSSWKPVAFFSFSELKPLFGYSTTIGINNIFTYLTRNLDNFIVAKFIGGTALGLYTNAYRLMMFPVSNISGIFSSVLFAGFSKMSEDLTEIARVYLKTISIISFVSFPMMVGLFSVAEEFVIVMYGTAWIEIIPIIKLLSLLGAIQSILFLNGTIFNAVGKPRIAFVTTVVLNVVLLIAWVIGLKMDGLIGFVKAYFIISGIGSVIILYNAIRFIGLNLTHAFKAIRYQLFGAVFMGVIINLFKQYSLINLDYNWNLFILIVVGFFFYIVYSFFFQKSIIVILKSIRR